VKRKRRKRVKREVSDDGNGELHDASKTSPRELRHRRRTMVGVASV
jgi:hypothetical protein